MPLLICGLLLALSVSIAIVCRHYRHTVALGAPCGLALGFWFLAPFYLRTHHLFPETAAQWARVHVVFAVLFAVGGLVAAAVSGWVVGIAASGSARFRIPALASLTELVASLPVVLLAVGAVLESNLFGRTFWLRTLIVSSTAVATVIVPLLIWLIVFYHWSVKRQTRVSTRHVLVSLAILVLIGIVVLPLRIPRKQGASIRAEPLQRLNGPSGVGAPVLVIGLDAGNWRTLRPLIQRGELPTLAGLMKTGIVGDMRAESPPYWSSPAWGSIVTGHPMADLDVHEDLGASIRGLPRFEIPLTIDFRLNPLFLIELQLIRSGIMEIGPHGREDLSLAPIWERLHEAGIRTAVVHFPFTYPANGQADYVVSSRAVTDFWDAMGVREGDRELVLSSRGDPDRLRQWFDERAPIDRTLARSLLPEASGKPANTRIDPAVVLERALELSQRMFGVSEQIVSDDPSLDVLLLHLAEMDVMSHAFWPYRFPDDFPADFVPRSDVARLGPVLDRFLVDLDRRLGSLIRTFPEPPAVVVVSDHGAEASRFATIWHGWHSAEAIFLAAGPGVPHDERPLTVSYVDVVPTVLAMLGYRQPQDLTGRPVFEPIGRTTDVSANASLDDPRREHR